MSRIVCICLIIFEQINDDDDDDDKISSKTTKKYSERNVPLLVAATLKRLGTIVLGVFVLVQYLLIIFWSNQDAKLDTHIQVQSELLCNKHTQRHKLEQMRQTGSKG